MKGEWDEMEERNLQEEAEEGLSKYGFSSSRRPCPDDPKALCATFKVESADPWTAWAARVHIRYTECSCGNDLPDSPRQFTYECSQAGSCEEVCDAFRDWAFSYRRWALRITKLIDECFDDWQPNRKVPFVPRCGNCQQTCQAMQRFHRKLIAWADDIRYPLNEICDPGPTDRVPPPPTPPPFE